MFPNMATWWIHKLTSCVKLAAGSDFCPIYQGWGYAAPKILHTQYFPERVHKQK